MTSKTEEKKIVWVLVKAESGIPVDVKVFDDFAKAEKRRATWERNHNPGDDAVGLFETSINGFAPSEAL